MQTKKKGKSCCDSFQIDALHESIEEILVKPSNSINDSLEEDESMFHSFQFKLPISVSSNLLLWLQGGCGYLLPFITFALQKKNYVVSNND